MADIKEKLREIVKQGKADLKDHDEKVREIKENARQSKK